MLRALEIMVSCSKGLPTWPNLKCFSDAEWEEKSDDCRSISGQCVFLGNNLIPWSAKKQHTIVKSSTESEYHSLAHSMFELSWIFHILRDLHISMAHTSII